MEQTTIQQLVSRRSYSELEKRADEYIENDDWKGFLRHIQHTISPGKARDALVTLLELEAVGGTDSDIFKEFDSLEGKTLHEVRLDGVHHAMELLKDQIENRHTYFLDVESMAMTPYAILVQDVINARTRELKQLEKNPSRIDVLGTFYGFTILMVEGSQPHDNSTSTAYGWRRWRRRTWLDENITDTAAQAVKSLTGQFAEEVDMDKKYRTLGSSPIFKSRCMKGTANILADAVRLSMYKMPGNRGTAAQNLGRTGDSRVLPFLHHRFGLDQSRKVRIKIAEALGQVGHISSIETLKDQVNPTRRGISKDIEATIHSLGGIYCPESKRALLEIVDKGGNTIKAAAIQALGKQDPHGLVKVIMPYLEHKSRPVVRASVMALFDIGDSGKDAILTKVPTILKKIGYDRPSRQAVTRLMQIPEVGKMRAVQEFYITKINKMRKEVERWKRYEQRGSYSYWYRRREQRAIDQLRDTVQLVNQYVKPPFHVELMGTVKAAMMMYTNPDNNDARFGDSAFGRAFREYINTTKQRRDKITHEQMYFG
ncbi:HEAT repeat domain-containing protein [Candidatus Thorarchaeota archaeon]|nr:MAG: HEAT repeat domain-containing protein [Candidatus Thorarchaeota archaeon]